jgi:DNA-binding winged helix-turn-helix (wHTH) protein
MTAPAVVLLDVPGEVATRWASALRRAGRAVILASGVDPARLAGDVVVLDASLGDLSDAAVLAAVEAREGRATALRLSGALVDLEREIVLRDGQEVPLTAQEAAMLRVLAAARGAVVDRDTLLRDVWGHKAAVVTRAVDNAAARLRAKLEADPSEPVHLLTVRGAGYRLAGARSEAAAARAAAPLPVVAPPGLIGREADLAALSAALEAAPLVTITGAPGVGKSALSRAAAAARGGVEVQARDLAATALPPGTLALVDDADAEHDAILEALPRVLARGVRLIVTSRRPLGSAQERRLRLRPLADPDAARLCAARGLPGLPLDGLPLAVELAAAASRLVPVEELGGIEHLAHPTRRPARHRRWIDAVAPSWEALDPAARELAGWAARRGAFTLDDAPGDGIAALADRSLLERDGDRFGMLPLVAAAVRVLEAR